jgi:multidrug efflux pump subunit AcrA (membrane-fusion protein)
MVPAGYVQDGKIRVEADGEVKTVEVKTGKRDGTMIQVLEGLEAGATVLPPEAEAQPATTESEGN